jgi:hypothetical protein
MRFLDRLISRKEERLALEDDPFKDPGPFRLGSFRSALDPDFSDIDEMVSAISREMASAEEFYRNSDHDGVFRVAENSITYKSAFSDGTPNDLVHVDIVRESHTKRAVIVIPHWNTKDTSYVAMGGVISHFGFSVFVITLPHHSTRGGPRNEQVANDFLNANLGAAIRSVRQSVADTRLLIDWLRKRGYEDINLIGVSLGSCIAALVAAFDRGVMKTVLFLTAGDFAETVWTGRATAHIRRQMDDQISLGELQQIWAIISPLNYVKNFAANGSQLRIISGRRDQVVLFRLATAFVRALSVGGVQLSWRVLPCGHYTLAVFPFNIISLYQTIRFLKSRRMARCLSCINSGAWS